MGDMDCYHNGVECFRNDGSSHCSETMGGGGGPCSADDMCAGCMYDGNGMTVMGDMDCYHNGVECFRNDGTTHCSETMGGGGGPCSMDDMCAGCMYDGTGMTVMGTMDCSWDGVECYRNDGSSHCSE